MKKFEIGTYRKYFTAFDGDFSYTIEKVTAKTVTVTIHKGGKYEKSKKCKIFETGKSQYCEAFGFTFESDDEKIA